MSGYLSPEVQAIAKQIAELAQRRVYGPNGDEQCRFVALNPVGLAGVSVNDLLVALPGWQARVLTADNFSPEVARNVPPQTLNTVILYPPQP